MKWMLPFVAAASPLNAHAERFFLDYDGVVTQSINEPAYTRGDPISGRLIVDLAQAGPDGYPEDPNQTAYDGDGNDFVTGFLSPRDDFPTADFIGWLNQPRGEGNDFFDVVDGQIEDEFNYRRLDINAYGFNLFNTADPHGFEYTPADHVTFFAEFSTRLKGTINGLMQFAISRLSLRPEKCFG